MARATESKQLIERVAGAQIMAYIQVRICCKQRLTPTGAKQDSKVFSKTRTFLSLSLPCPPVQGGGRRCSASNRQGGKAVETMVTVGKQEHGRMEVGEKWRRIWSVQDLGAEAEDSGA